MVTNQEQVSSLNKLRSQLFELVSLLNKSTKLRYSYILYPFLFVCQHAIYLIPHLPRYLNSSGPYGRRSTRTNPD